MPPENKKSSEKGKGENEKKNMDIGGHSGIPPVSPDKGCIPADTHGMLSGTVSPAGRCLGSHCGPACVMAFMEVREWVL